MIYECQCDGCNATKAKEKPRTYEQGFRDGMSCDQKYPQSLMLMGYDLHQWEGSQWTAEEISKMKEKQMEINKINTLMTKEEAEKKMYAAGLCKDMSTGRFLILEALETLGIIKFKEPKMVVAFNSKDYPKGVTIVVDGQPIYQK